MTTATLFDAKTHFSTLIAQVERDRASITITKHGRPVPRLVPYTEDPPLADRRAAALAEVRAASQRAGIRYDRVEAVASLPTEYWGVFAGAPVVAKP